jgi:hypothetical protein
MAALISLKSPVVKIVEEESSCRSRTCDWFTVPGQQHRTLSAKDGTGYAVQEAKNIVASRIRWRRKDLHISGSFLLCAYYSLEFPSR